MIICARFYRADLCNLYKSTNRLYFAFISTFYNCEYVTLTLTPEFHKAQNGQHRIDQKKIEGWVRTFLIKSRFSTWKDIMDGNS